jgi:hypothetical protein
MAGTMRAVFLHPRDKKIAKNTAKMALLATAALATPPAYAVTPSPLTVVYTAAAAMVQNRAFHELRAPGVLTRPDQECRWRKLYH